MIEVCSKDVLDVDLARVLSLREGICLKLA